MNDQERHLILYAKHWYERPNQDYSGTIQQRAEQQITDLQYILSIIYDYEYKRHDIWFQLVTVFLKYVEPNQQQSFLEKMFESDAIFGPFEENAKFYYLVHKILGQFAITMVQDNPKMEGLGEPDYKMFPLLNAKAEIAGGFFKKD